MTYDEALELALMVNEVQKGRFGPELFELGTVTSIGQIWLGIFENEEDVDLATQAVVQIYSTAPPEVGRLRAVTPSDFKEVLRALKSATYPPALEEEEIPFGRPLDAWIKGWIVARMRDDLRVWPQQKEAYDELQHDNPYQRSYIWGEQNQMPAEERRAYEEQGSHLTATQVGALVASLA